MTINQSINIMRNVHAFLEEVLFGMIVSRKKAVKKNVDIYFSLFGVFVMYAHSRKTGESNNLKFSECKNRIVKIN